jgi:hypothetical protein
MSNIEETKKKYRLVYHEYQSLFNKKNEDEDDDFDGLAFDNEVEQDESGNLDILNSDMMVEPFLVSSEGAIIPVKDYGPTKAVYNFWTAHSNFDITKDIIDIIDNIEGVETLEQFTRYRLRIGVGKLFKPRDVFIQLDKEVFEYLKSLDEE